MPITVAAGLAAITLAALVLRMVTLGEQSYWVDESYTVHLVRLGFGSMLSTIPRTESTPPLYYVLAWCWRHAFGTGEVGLRSLSALAGTGSVLLGGLIGRRLAGPRAALITALLLAVSPLLVWFSQEARAYALATLLTAAALLFLLRYAEARRPRDLAGWAVTAALALCTHYFTAFVILPGAVWLAVTGRRSPAARTALVVVGAAAAALVPLALAQRGTGNANYIAIGSLSIRLLQIPKQMLIGYASPGQVITAGLAAVLLLAGVAPALRAGWARVPAAAARAGGRSLPAARPARVPLAAGLIAGAAVAGVLLPVLLALVGIDFIDTRNLLATLPAFAALAAAGLSAPASGRLGAWCAAGLAVVSLAVVALVDTHPAYQRINWRGAVQALGPLTEPRVIVINPQASLPPVRAYAPDARLLSGAIAVRELEYVEVPGGTVPLPPPAPITIPPPAGFVRVAGGVRTGYSFLRFRSARPVTVTAAQLGALPLGRDRIVLVQTPR
ncbi:MAG TPA: glycosyltransferase family 39 protein [Solirubrobacteraceae bacterium]|nr:glycosyltransferase family 39 protein [Solirubrobacteraceae bacterium]